MKQMDDMIAKMTDANKKKEAKMHLDMSKAEMKKGDSLLHVSKLSCQCLHSGCVTAPRLTKRTSKPKAR